MIALLGLGSNLGDRLAHLEAGVRGLARHPAITPEAVSSVYETAPVGYLDQPPFLNAAVRVRTTLGPLDLLDACQRVESDEGRIRSFPNAPRTLDIDLLSCSDDAPGHGGTILRMETARLVLPHPRMAERDFVRIPLREMETGCVGRSAGVAPWLWGWDPLGSGPGSDRTASGLEPHRLVRHCPESPRFPVTIRYRRRTESTNDDIRRLAAAGAPEGTVALAEEQTAGRGRFGRTWDSAAGLGVWMTVLFRPGEGCRDAGLYPVAAAVAACRALRRLGAPEAGVKWPNDILWRGRKLCGILCEGASSGGAVEWVAVGVGVDVLHTEDQLPSVPGLPPVSLALCRKAAEDGASGDPTESGAPDGDDLRARTAAALLYELEETGRMVATGATRELVDEYRRMSLLIGRDVRIESPGGTFEARATGIDEEGRLLVEAPDGPRALVNGEVTVRTVQEGRT